MFLKIFYATPIIIKICNKSTIFQIKVMSFLNKEERAKCWGHRDEYWKCLTENAPQHSSTSGEKVPEPCRKFRKLFESSCPSTWVKHFDRKRTYEQFKEKIQKGYDPLDDKQQKMGQ